MDRKRAFAAMAEVDAEVCSLLECWYGEPATHNWRNAEGAFETLLSSQGFDQGCPLAAAGLSIGQRKALEGFLAQLQLLDPQAKL